MSFYPGRGGFRERNSSPKRRRTDPALPIHRHRDAPHTQYRGHASGAEPSRPWNNHITSRPPNRIHHAPLRHSPPRNSGLRSGGRSRERSQSPRRLRTGQSPVLGRSRERGQSPRRLRTGQSPVFGRSRERGQSPRRLRSTRRSQSPGRGHGRGRSQSPRRLHSTRRSQSPTRLRSTRRSQSPGRGHGRGRSQSPVLGRSRGRSQSPTRLRGTRGSQSPHGRGRGQSPRRLHSPRGSQGPVLRRSSSPVGRSVDSRKRSRSRREHGAPSLSSTGTRASSHVHTSVPADGRASNSETMSRHSTSSPGGSSSSTSEEAENELEDDDVGYSSSSDYDGDGDQKLPEEPSTGEWRYNCDRDKLSNILVSNIRRTQRSDIPACSGGACGRLALSVESFDPSTLSVRCMLTAGNDPNTTSPDSVRMTLKECGIYKDVGAKVDATIRAFKVKSSGGAIVKEHVWEAIFELTLRDNISSVPGMDAYNFVLHVNYGEMRELTLEMNFVHESSHAGERAQLAALEVLRRKFNYVDIERHYEPVKHKKKNRIYVFGASGAGKTSLIQGHGINSAQSDTVGVKTYPRDKNKIVEVMGFTCTAGYMGRLPRRLRMINHHVLLNGLITEHVVEAARQHGLGVHTIKRIIKRSGGKGQKTPQMIVNVFRPSEVVYLMKEGRSLSSEAPDAVIFDGDVNAPVVLVLTKVWDDFEKALPLQARYKRCRPDADVWHLPCIPIDLVDLKEKYPDKYEQLNHIGVVSDDNPFLKAVKSLLETSGIRHIFMVNMKDSPEVNRADAFAPERRMFMLADIIKRVTLSTVNDYNTSARDAVKQLRERASHTQGLKKSSHGHTSPKAKPQYLNPIEYVREAEIQRKRVQEGKVFLAFVHCDDNKTPTWRDRVLCMDHFCFYSFREVVVKSYVLTDLENSPAFQSVSTQTESLFFQRRYRRERGSTGQFMAYFCRHPAYLRKYTHFFFLGGRTLPLRPMARLVLDKSGKPFKPPLTLCHRRHGELYCAGVRRAINAKLRPVGLAEILEPHLSFAHPAYLLTRGDLRRIIEVFQDLPFDMEDTGEFCDMMAGALADDWLLPTLASMAGVVFRDVPEWGVLEDADGNRGDPEALMNKAGELNIYFAWKTTLPDLHVDDAVIKSLTAYTDRRLCFQLFNTGLRRPVGDAPEPPPLVAEEMLSVYAQIGTTRRVMVPLEYYTGRTSVGRDDTDRGLSEGTVVETYRLVHGENLVYGVTMGGKLQYIVTTHPAWGHVVGRGVFAARGFRVRQQISWFKGERILSQTMLSGGYLKTSSCDIIRYCFLLLIDEHKELYAYHDPWPIPVAESTLAHFINDYHGLHTEPNVYVDNLGRMWARKVIAVGEELVFDYKDGHGQRYIGTLLQLRNSKNH